MPSEAGAGEGPGVRGGMSVGPRTVIAWAAALAAAATAVAQPAAAAGPGGRLISGPVLSGDEAVWVRAVGRGAEVRAAGPGGGRVLGTLPAGRPGQQVVAFGLAGSPAGVAISPSLKQNDAFGTTQSDLRFLVAPPGGQLREVGRCNPTRQGAFTMGVAMSDVAAFQSYSCEDGAFDKIRFWSPDGLEQLPPPSGEAALVGAAGPFVAWTSDVTREVTVYDRSRQAVAYVARADRLGRFAAAALGDDGRLAVSYSPGPDIGSNRRLAVFGPGERAPHLVPGRRLSSAGEIKLAGDRLGVAVRRGGGAQLHLVELSTGRITAVGPLTFERFFDLQGNRLTWLDPACSGPRVRVVDLPARFHPRRRPCRIPFAKPPRLRGRKLVFRLDCRRLATTTCIGGIAVGVRRQGRRPRIIGGASGGARYAISLRADARLLRRIRRGSARLRLTFVWLGRYGEREERVSVFRSAVADS